MSALFKNNLTPEKLSQEPSLLLHNKPTDGHVYGPFDGLCGAVILGGDHFITTPNYHIIYDPPLGGDRQVYLRENLRYGIDDPLQWPQPLIRNLVHFAVMRLPVRNAEDPLHIMWWLPTKSDFVEDPTSLISGLGRLHIHKTLVITTLCLSLLQRAEPFKLQSDLFPNFINTLSASTYRLKHLANFEAMLRIVRAVQRLYLEVLALVDYFDVHKPIMEGRKVAPPGLAPVMGAFVSDPSLCEMFLKAHIRVWLIRPYTALDNARIRKIPMVPHRTFHVIFKGSANDPVKHQKILAAVKSVLQYPNPFSSSRATLDPWLPFIATSESTSEPPKKRIRLDNKPEAKEKGSPGRNKYEDPKTGNYPPAIPAWHDALSSVANLLTTQVSAQSDSIDMSYAFPDPAALAVIERADRQQHMYQNWLRWRSAFIYRLSVHDSQSTTLSSKAWKKLLSLGFETIVNTQRSTTGPTKSSTLAEDVQKILKACFSTAQSQSSKTSVEFAQ
ncbi:hypothetical protein BDN72DRAFT_860009, partial [Pluteus cervinus]